MIAVLTIAFNQYMTIPFENYKEKLISALGLLELVDNKEKDIEDELNFIELNTHKKINFNFYSLDRFLVHRKQNINSVDDKLKILPRGKTESIELTESQINIYLSLAIRRVHQLVLKSLEGYKLEQKINMGDDNETESDKEIIKLFKN